MGVLPSFLGIAVPIQNARVVPIQNARVERRNMVAKHGVLSILKANHWRFLSRTPELNTSVNRGTWRKTEVVGRIIRIASPEERQLLEAGWLKGTAAHKKHISFWFWYQVSVFPIPIFLSLRHFSLLATSPHGLVWKWATAKNPMVYHHFPYFSHCHLGLYPICRHIQILDWYFPFNLNSHEIYHEYPIQDGQIHGFQSPRSSPSPGSGQCPSRAEAAERYFGSLASGF